MRTLCRKCKTGIKWGDFAYNQEICFDCFVEEVELIKQQIDSNEEHSEVWEDWMLLVVAELYGRKR